MKKFKSASLFSLLAVFVLMFSACGETEGSLSSGEAPPVIGKAPQWSLKNLEGAEVQASDFAGRVVVIDFWATWCPPCRKEIPGYIELQKKYEEQGLVIVGISLDQAGVGVVDAFRGKTGINYPLVMGNDEVVSAFGGVEGIPTTFVVDREGNLRYKKVGYMAKDKMEAWIKSLL